MKSFTHAFGRYLLRACNMSATLFVAGTLVVNETDQENACSHRDDGS